MDGFNGKFVEWRNLSPRRIFSTDLDVLLCGPHPFVSRTVVNNKKDQPKIDQASSALDCILSIMGISDKSSLSLHTTLNNLGLDSIMASEIKEVLEKEFNLKLSPSEVRLLTVKNLNEISTFN